MNVSHKQGANEIQTVAAANSLVALHAANDRDVETMPRSAQSDRQRASDTGTKRCVMCSAEAPFVSSRKEAKTKASRLMLRHDRCVCACCRNIVWNLVGSGIEFRRCQLCQTWCPWAGFQSLRKLMTMCSRCRNTCAKHYAKQKQSAVPASSSGDDSSKRAIEGRQNGRNRDIKPTKKCRRMMRPNQVTVPRTAGIRSRARAGASQEDQSESHPLAPSASMDKRVSPCRPIVQWAVRKNDKKRNDKSGSSAELIGDRDCELGV